MIILFLSILLFWACFNLYHALVSHGPGRATQGGIVPGILLSLVLWHVVIIGCIYLLGELHLLSRSSILFLVVIAIGLFFGVSFYKQRGSTAFVKLQKELLDDVLELPKGLVRACRYAGFPLWPVVVFGSAVFAYLFFAAFVSPSRGNNDALFYHEPIVALTLQYGHLGPFDLPAHLQRINGMPRFVHLLQLWFALLNGRELVEMANLIAQPVGMLATYGLIRKIGGQKSVAIAWAFCWMLTPGILRLTAGIMVDPSTAALCAAAAYCVLVPELTVFIALTAASAIALTIGTKFHVVVLSFVLSIALLIRILSRRHTWSKGTLGFALVSCASIIFMGLGAVFLRNLYFFENPIWPGGIHIPGTDIRLKAPHDMKDVLLSGKGLSLGGILDQWTASPYTVRAWGGSSARPEDYGPAGVFIAWPAALVATVVVFVRTLLLKLQKRTWPKNHGVLLVLAFLMLVSFATFPSVVRGRYWMASLSTFYVFTCYWTLAPKKRALGRQIAFVASVLMIISAIWAMRIGMIPFPSEIAARLEVPREERDYTRRQLSSILPDAGKIRKDEFKAGTKVGFDSGYSIGLLWNDDYSNEVYWIKSRNIPGEAVKRDFDWLFIHTKTFGSHPRWDDAPWEFATKVLRRSNRHPGRLYKRTRDDEAVQKKREKSKKAKAKAKAKAKEQAKKKEAETRQRRENQRRKEAEKRAAHAKKSPQVNDDAVPLNGPLRRAQKLPTLETQKPRETSVTPDVASQKTK